MCILNIFSCFIRPDFITSLVCVLAIFYLNDNWDESYGGKLSLYDQQLNAISSIAPIGNRIVIFSTSDTSFHGHPERLTCPKNKFRKSIALYYYSAPTIDRKKSRILFPTEPGFVVSPTKE
jgi:hypothetical protein